MKHGDYRLALILAVALVVSVLILLFSGIQSDVPAVGNTDLYITEICAKNDSIVPDHRGQYRDYVEIYNAADTVNLRGFRLTDGKGTSEPFGDLYLTRGSYRVFFLSQETTGFSLSADDGDSIQLLDPQGNVVCQANTAPMSADQVMLYRDGHYTLSTQASPGFANDDAGLAAFRQGEVVHHSQLQISELLVDNVSALPNEQGVFADVVELYNSGEDTLNLADFWLSDSLSSRFRCRLPDQLLEPGQYAVVFCDGGSGVDARGAGHVSFGLSAGESLCLTDRQGRSVTVDAGSTARRNTSWIRADSGEYIPGDVSLGYPNTEQGVTQFLQGRLNPDSPLVITEVLISAAGVPYRQKITDVVEIYNRSNETVDTFGWCLSDGGDPYQCPLPRAKLAPGEYLLVECSQESAGFGISQGETVFLMGPDGKISQPVTCVLTPGQSICLQNGMTYGPGPVSLGYANTPQGQEAFAQDQLPGGLRISEVVTANYSLLNGPYGKASDWVELYNASREPLNLRSYALGTRTDLDDAVALPDVVLEPGQYLVILLDDDPLNMPQGYFSLPVKLSSRGEGLYLSQAGSLVDGLYIPQLTLDQAYGRAKGKSSFTVLAQPTPGQTNGNGAQMAPMPTAKTPQGVYDGVSYVDVVLEGEGEIYYTTDASTPDGAAHRYTGPIRLTRTTVIRAVCRAPGAMDSRTLDLTYVINENDNLSVVTLVVEPEDLWSWEKGIYVFGNGAQADLPHYGANFWQDWEKPATVSLFEAEGGGFTASCGLRIFGGFSRIYDKKSVACMFRDTYGMARLEYPLFGQEGLDTYEAFVLRAGGQDYATSRIRDELTTSVVGQMTDIPVQQYRPVMVYINGEYWGLHFIREKINEQYVAGHYSVRAETVVIGERHGEELADYQALLDYVENHDLSQPECYEWVCQRVDVPQYMDYVIAQLCCGNQDNSNVKFFRVGDSGKWTWFFYDLDFAFREADYNAFENHLNPAGTTGYGLSTALINGLLENPQFREDFLRRLAWQINNIWTEENMLMNIHRIADEVNADMAKECQRWNQDYEKWRMYVTELEMFARARPRLLLNHVRWYFGLSNDEMRSYGFPI